MYRDLIDALVDMCHRGQGQVGARRVREGVWNGSADEALEPEQHKINLLLSSLSTPEREVLALMLTQQVEVGVFETLKTLEQFEIPPFEAGYEGSPFHAEHEALELAEVLRRLVQKQRA